MSRRQITGWISFIQFICVIAGVPLFIFWGQWFDALSREEAVVNYPELPLPDPCDAVLPGRGELRRWEYGTISQTPWGFAACSVGVFTAWGAVVYTVRLSEKSRK